MGHYNPAQLKKQALRAINKHQLIKHAQVQRAIGCGKNTYYNYGLNLDEDINNAIEDVKESIKAEMRVNWADKKANPILQLGLYKILGDEDERQALGVQQQKDTNINISVTNIKEMSDADLERFVSEGRKLMQDREKNLPIGSQTLQLGPAPEVNGA